MFRKNTIPPVNNLRINGARPKRHYPGQKTPMTAVPFEVAVAFFILRRHSAHQTYRGERVNRRDW